MWPPLERKGTLAGAVWIVGVTLVIRFVNGPRDPGAEYTDHWGFFTFLAGLAFYSVLAGLAWLVLWFIGFQRDRH